jgi:hypothetical protein
VVSKVRDIHGTAYGWNSNELVSDDFIIKLVQDWTSFGDEHITRKPRPVLRDFIHKLDLCEENPGIDLNEFFGLPLNNTTKAKDIVDILNE